jgi:hypothetical protein
MSLTNAPVGQREIILEPKPVLRQSKEAESTAKKSYWRELLPRSPSEIFLLAVVVVVISLHLKYLLDVRTEVPLQDDWNFLNNMFRSVDTHRTGAWVFGSTNGHFVVPGALAYLCSSHYLSLDLTPLRLLNFPICLAAFLLTAHVINLEVRPRFLRFYLYAGTGFLVFNLCFWEHLALGCGFSAILSALFGGIGLYHIAKATQTSARWKIALLIGLVFLVASVLSLGAGYAATAAAVSLLALIGLKKLAASRPMPNYRTIIYGLTSMLGLLAVLAHPFFHLTGRITKAVYHSVLLAGSTGSSFIDKSSLTAQNVAFASGIILIAAALWIGCDFLTSRSSRNRLLPTFALALVLFGLTGCVAVAIARSYLPNAEFLNSRYTLYPSLCLLGILLYFAYTKVFLLTHMWCFIAAGYLLATVKEQQIGFYRPQMYRKIEVAIINMDTLSDEQLKATLYWRENIKGVRKVVARMRRDRLNVFRSVPNPK